MSLYEEYIATDYLETDSFIAGSDHVFEFIGLNDSNELFDVSACEMKWMLSPYAQPEYNLIQKTAIVSGSSSFIVSLSGNETINLGGVYLQQMEVTDGAGHVERPAQGIVIIRKAIPTQ